MQKPSYLYLSPAFRRGQRYSEFYATMSRRIVFFITLVRLCLSKKSPSRSREFDRDSDVRVLEILPFPLFSLRTHPLQSIPYATDDSEGMVCAESSVSFLGLSGHAKQRRKTHSPLSPADPALVCMRADSLRALPPRTCTSLHPCRHHPSSPHSVLPHQRRLRHGRD